MRHRRRSKHAAVIWLTAVAGGVLSLTAPLGCGGSSRGTPGTQPPPVQKGQRPVGTVMHESFTVLETMTYQGQPMVFRRASHPLDGLEIKVNKGIAAGAKFELSAAVIKGHTFQRQVNTALTPMIRVRCDQPVSEGTVLTPITVTLPTTVSAGATMADYPVAVSVDPSGSWLNFVTYSVNRTDRRVMIFPKVMPMSESKEVGGAAPFFLAKPANPSPQSRSSDSGFTPGVDDWPFVNIGTTNEQAGTCSGMSIMAGFHYALKRISNGPLRNYRQFNEGTVCEEGNDDPLRPCAFDDRDALLMVQDVQGKYNNLFHFGMIDENGDPTPPGGMAPFEALAQAKAIHQSGWPALVALYNKDGAHAVLCYATTDKTLLIADPNRPGERREIIAKDPLYWETFDLERWFDFDGDDDDFEQYSELWVIDISKLPLGQLDRIYRQAEQSQFNQEIGSFDITDWCQSTQKVQGEKRLQFDNEVFFLSDNGLKNRSYYIFKYLVGDVETELPERTERGYRIDMADPKFKEPEEDCDWCQDAVPDPSKIPPRARIHIPIFRDAYDDEGEAQPVWHEALLLDVKTQPMKLKD